MNTRAVRRCAPAPQLLFAIDGDTAVQMDATKAGARLYWAIRADPARTRILRWRWHDHDLIAGAGLKRKVGDDLPARLYVMFDYPLDRLSRVERGKILLARSIAGDLVPTA